MKFSNVKQKIPHQPLIEEEITVILPTLNEVKNIEKMISKIMDLYPSIHIRVVDDGSLDGTVEWIEKTIFADTYSSKLTFLNRKDEIEKGITASVSDAIQSCQTLYFIVMDCDFQHPPEAIHGYFSVFERGGLFAIGTRKPYRQVMSATRFLTSQVATYLTKAYCRFRKIRVEDPMSGFFGGQVSLVKDLITRNKGNFELRGYKILFDLLKDFDANVPIQDVYYDFQERKSGDSKLSPRHAFFLIRSFFS